MRRLRVRAAVADVSAAGPVMPNEIYQPSPVVQAIGVATICLAALVGTTTRPSAATPDGLGALPNRGTPPSSIGRMAGQTDPQASQRPLNPFERLRIESLTATRDRPLFSASRRPPPRAVVGPIVEPVQPVAPPPTEPSRPQLAMIGSIVSKGDAIAVLVDQATQQVQLLRRGDVYAGWTVDTVQRREVTLRQDSRLEVFPLSPAAVADSAASSEPGMAISAGGNSYAPFIPRSTPKNGESDGL